MDAYAYPGSQERLISGASALGMHLLFVALLIFGVNWQKHAEPQPNIVELWTNLQPKAEPVPEPPPPAPPPETKPEVQPAEPPKVVAKPEVAKPDIAIKDKVEKERRVVEPKQPETKKREEDTQAAQKQQAAETQRLAREQEDAQRKLGEQAASARLALIDKYKRAISEKIKKFIVLPPNMQGNPESEFDVVALPDGNVLNARLKRSSGNTAYDNAVERAINRAQPLPMPPDPALLKEFRELNLKFKPQE